MADKVVVRYTDGNVLKGYLSGFTGRDDHILLSRTEGGDPERIATDRLKAIFFVRSFEGKSDYNEKKVYGISEKRGDRAFVKFKDGESIVGFLSGDVPWDREKGFFLSRISPDIKGFYMLPVDRESNNIKIFVMISAVEDVTVMV